LIEYTLIELLLSWKEQGTPELPSAQQMRILVNPAQALSQIPGYILRGKDIGILFHMSIIILTY